MRDTAETGLNHGIETNHQAVSADLEDAVPLNLHVHERKKETSKEIKNTLMRNQKETRSKRESVRTLAGVRPGNGPDVDVDVFGFLHNVTDFNTFYPRMGHDLFCRPP